MRGKGLAGSAAVMFAGTLTSRILGLVRSALLVAAIYSLGGAADSFAVANKLPNIIYMLLAGGVLNAVLVPQIVRAMRHRDGGQEYVNRLLTLAGTLLAAVTVLLTLAAPVLVTLYAAEFRSGPWAQVAISFAMWTLPQLFFYGMYTLLGQVLNARSVFGPYMWAPAANNLIAITGLVIYLVAFGSFDPANPDPASAFTADRIALLGGTATLGVVIQAAVLVVPLAKSGFRFRFTWGLRGSGLGRATRVAWWAFLALLAGQVGYLAISNIAAAASTSAEQAGTYAAGNAAWDAAFLVFMLPQSLITVSLVTAIFTRLSNNAASGNSGQVREDLSMGLRSLGVFTVFAAGAVSVLAIPVVQVVQFDQAAFEAYQAVGAVLVALAMGLPAMAIWTMTQRVYFAYEDTKALFGFQVPMALIQILGCLLALWLLPVQWWVVGAAAANSVSLLFGALISYLALRRKLRSLDGSRVLRTYLRLTLAIVPTIAVGWGLLSLWGVQTGFFGALLRVLVLGALMALVYVIFLRRLRVSELDTLTARAGALAAPLTNRLGPVLLGVPGLARVRTMWGRITGTEPGRAQRMTMRRTRALSSGEVLAGRYRMVGAVAADRWLGADTILDREVHIRAVTGENREAALDAARRAALIRDDRFLRILRVGTHDGVGFVVTEILQGDSLADLVNTARLHPDQARTLVGEAAQAMEAARRRGVHHLCLGPNSLYRTTSGEVLITGLAVDAGTNAVTSETDRTATRTDTIDLVALLYTALTGYWPGPPDRAGKVPLAPRHDGQPVPPGELLDDIPEDLDTLCAVTFGPHRDGPFSPGELVRDLAPWAEPGTGAVYHPSAKVPPGAPGTGTWAASFRRLGPGYVPQWNSIGGAAASTAAGGAAVGAGQAGFSSATLGVDPLNVASGGGADAFTPPGGAGPSPASTADTTGWAPKEPPQDQDLPEFGSLVQADREDGAHALDTYQARHQRSMFDSRLEPPPSPDPRRGATAVPGPAERRASVPPTVDPPPGEPPTSGTVHTAPPSARATKPFGTPFAPSANRAAGGAGIGAGASAALASATKAAGQGLRTIGSKTAEATRQIRDSTVALAQSWRSAEDPTQDVDTAASTGASEDGGGNYPEFVAHPTASSDSEPPEEFNPVSEDFWDSDDEPERFNPTPVIILTMIAVVVVAAVLAISTLRDTSFEPDPAPATPPPGAAATDEQDGTEEEIGVDENATKENEGTEAEEEDADGPDPVIDSVRSLDDNPELAYLAADGDSETIWRSLRYNDPRYGMKPGLGFVIELEEETLVSSVTLDVQGQGGTVQIRTESSANPESGPVLAEGAMGPDVTYELSEPTETDVVVLWFPELPVADSDGRNRIELAEIEVD